MAEFDQLTNDTQPERLLPDGRTVPADFACDDIELAAWLNGCFDVQGENLPPRYAQTLLGEPEHAAATEDFEERIAAQVFKRLHIPRPGPAQPVVRRALAAGRTPGRAVRRGALAVMAAVALLSLNALTSGAALASVVSLMIGGGGAKLVSHYPTQIVSEPKTTQAVDPIPHFTPQWPGPTVAGYSFQGEDIYAGRSWSDGALVSLRYQLTDAQGLVHHMTILEFVPKALKVLQVVQDGSATAIPFGANNGVFIMGHWVRHGHAMVWQQGQRAELICSGVGEPGLVLWIAADSLSDLAMPQAQALLSQFALSLRPLRYTDLPATNDSVRYLGNQLTDAIEQSFGNDVIALIPDTGSTDGQATTYLRIVPSDSAGTTTTITTPGIQP